MFNQAFTQAVISLLAFFLALSLVADSAHAAKEPEFTLRTVKVIDGDSISAEMPGVHPKLTRVIVRVYGIDTPESGASAKCFEEKVLAAKAKTFAINTVTNAHSIRYDIIGWDKYGGRILADVYVDNISLAETLVIKGLARPYFGDKKKSWCTSS